MSNKLTQIAREILSTKEDLPFRFDYNENPHPTLDDFELYTFEQIWGSTALGFGGIGGQMLTNTHGLARGFPRHKFYDRGKDLCICSCKL